METVKITVDNAAQFVDDFRNWQAIKTAHMAVSTNEAKEMLRLEADTYKLRLLYQLTDADIVATPDNV